MLVVKGLPGWGIPMATDIAFVIGIMAILGSKVPVALKVFVTALAIADDIGAVLVIAIFYTSEISIISLAVAGGILILLITANLLGLRTSINLHYPWNRIMAGIFKVGSACDHCRSFTCIHNSIFFKN